MSGGPKGAKYSLIGEGEYLDDPDEFWGYVHDATGLFTALPDSARQVELLGCAPQGRLRHSLEYLGGKRANAGNGYLKLLDPLGAEIGSYFINHVTPVAVQPSARGSGLVDLTVRLRCELMMPGADWPWELIRTKQLNRTGLWHSLDPAGRHAWLEVALNHHSYRGIPDDPPDTHYELDGRYIVDKDSFYCALGEAVNGPGGYFGWNLDALDDCLRGRWGATTPFTLHWNHSDVARLHLATQQETSSGTMALFDIIMEILHDHHVDVALH